MTVRPELGDETFAALRDHVVPSVDELRWCEVPWRRCLREAAADAAARTMPILLWAMDGNPLGMTCGNGILGRELIWSDPEVRALAARFVPAADDAGRLVRGRGPDCDLFRRVAEHGHFGGRTVPTTTRQGIYALTAGGRLLASGNLLDPRAVVRMLEVSLQRWGALSHDERRSVSLPPAPDDARPPAPAGLVLRVYARDLPAARVSTDDWNQDHMWWSVPETLALVPEGSVGARRRAPDTLARRLARFHLVDDVHGQSIAFPPDAIEHAELHSEVTAVDGGSVTLRLIGRMRAAETGRWPVHGFEDVAHPSQQTRGYDMDLLGRAVFARERGRFRSFELVAAGLRWGATQYNRRGDDRGPAPLGIVFLLCDDDRSVPAALSE